MATDSVTRDIVAAVKAVLDAAMDFRDTRPAELGRTYTLSPRARAQLLLFDAVDAYRAALLRVAEDEES